MGRIDFHFGVTTKFGLRAIVQHIIACRIFDKRSPYNARIHIVDIEFLYLFFADFCGGSHTFPALSHLN